MIEIAECKYLLPCGRCEKLGGPCDCNDVPIVVDKPCEHEWIFVEHIEVPFDYEKTEYKCRKCGQIKTSYKQYYPL